MYICEHFQGVKKVSKQDRGKPLMLFGQETEATYKALHNKLQSAPDQKNPVQFLKYWIRCWDHPEGS